MSKMNRYGNIAACLMILCIVATAPLIIFTGIWSVIPIGIILAVCLYYGQKIEKIKKANDVYTYKEIVAFTEGQRLYEHQMKSGKVKKFCCDFKVLESVCDAYSVVNTEKDS